jgi:hypothetical protein
MYEETIPIFIRSLSNLLKIMEKAEKHAKRKKIDPSVLLKKRLYSDMFNFTKQVQYTYFMALDATVNLSGVPAPKFAYDEKSMTELKKSVRRTVAFLRTIRSSDMKKNAKKRMPVFFDAKQKLSVADYVHNLALPNFFFHYVTAYDILRHNGVPIGKDDYLGSNLSK